ncbi:unnamed protein product [Polarella glacialis]|uniref:Cyclic nucleotide-binding domain-containing protein n=1 Tax=Polarella glacialis TaxID=89957 RepID=A0A813LSN8_POLGL|nr:unnamed protein product [Polarella glacialis]
MLVQVGRRYVSEQREVDPLFAQAMHILLARSKVFAGVHDEFIRDLIVSCTRKEFLPNRFVMEEGMKGDSMYVLFKGVVEVTADGRYVCKLRDGSIFGESSLLSIDNRRTASVRSMSKCDVAIISRFSFHAILEKYPWEKRKFQREMKANLLQLGKLIDVNDDINLEQQATQCDALKSIPFFASDASLHDFVAELAMNASSLWYPAGKVVIQEGDCKCNDMFVLLRGSCEIYSCGQFLGRIEHDLFGEIGILDLLERRTASVITATPCQCMKFPRMVVIPVLAKYPDARLRLLEHARQRLMALNEVISGGGGPNQSAKALEDIASMGERYPGCAVGFGPQMDPQDAAYFAGSDLFRDAPLTLVHAISERMGTKRYDEGKVILKEGEPFKPERDFVYFIIKGQVEVWKTGNFVTVLSDGELFGELAAFRNHSIRQATVKCKTKVVLRLVNAASLVDVFNTHEDRDFMEKWNDILDTRSEQLMKKVKLADQLLYKTVDIEFMFMKLPGAQPDDRITPMNEPCVKALEGMEVYEWKPTGKTPVGKQRHLPPLTAR